MSTEVKIPDPKNPDLKQKSPDSKLKVPDPAVPPEKDGSLSPPKGVNEEKKTDTVLPKVPEEKKADASPPVVNSRVAQQLDTPWPFWVVYDRLRPVGSKSSNRLTRAQFAVALSLYDEGKLYRGDDNQILVRHADVPTVLHTLAAAG